MQSKVLVPLDGSELSERILSFVDVLPQRRTLDLVLLRVLRRVPAAELKACKDEFHDALAGLFRCEERLHEMGTRAVPLVTRGEYAAEQILRTVELLRPSLVAMSTHGHSGRLSEVRGGVAERVLQRCPAPLLLGNPSSLPLDPAAGFARILVPLDGSQDSASVLDMVADIARQHRSEVVLLTVDNVVETPASAQDELLRPFAERLRRSGVERVRCLTAVGDEATEILDAVSREGADLLAMTSHSRPDARGRFFGSVAAQVVTRCTSPLLLLRVGSQR